MIWIFLSESKFFQYQQRFVCFYVFHRNRQKIKQTRTAFSLFIRQTVQFFFSISFCALQLRKVKMSIEKKLGSLWSITIEIHLVFIWFDGDDLFILKSYALKPYECNAIQKIKWKKKLFICLPNKRSYISNNNSWWSFVCVYHCACAHVLVIISQYLLTYL